MREVMDLVATAATEKGHIDQVRAAELHTRICASMWNPVYRDIPVAGASDR
jgi:hypothetical protein